MLHVDRRWNICNYASLTAIWRLGESGLFLDRVFLSQIQLSKCIYWRRGLPLFSA